VDINKNHLPSQVKNAQLEFSQLQSHFSLFKLSNFLKKSGISKEKGIQPFELLLNFCGIIFKRSQSITQGVKLLSKSSQKSTHHEFLQNSKYNWNKLLLHVSKLYSNLFKHDEGGYTVLSIDDTARVKSGKNVEFISKFYDHSIRRFYMGYQVVLATLCNLRTCIPINFVIKTAPKLKKKTKKKAKKKSKQLSKNKAKKNNSSTQKYKRRPIRRQKSWIPKQFQSSRLSKIKIAIKLIKDALKHRIGFAFVLWDSWYNCSEAYEFIFKYLIPIKKIHLVSMIKLSKEKYKFLNKELNIKELYKLAGAWQMIDSNGVKYKSMVIEIISKYGKGRVVIGKVKLCFYRFPGQRKYKALISTNLDLSEEKILEIYTYRWTIEMVIKDLKSTFGFNLSKASKYQVHVADLAIRCILYMMVCAQKEREPHKSTYIILFEMSVDFENHCIEAVNKYFFMNTIDCFLAYAESIGITAIKELRAKCKTVVEGFFASEFYEDKIVHETEYYENQKGA